MHRGGKTNNGATIGHPAVPRRNGHTAQGEQAKVPLKFLLMTRSVDFAADTRSARGEGEQVR